MTAVVIALLIVSSPIWFPVTLSLLLNLLSWLGRVK